MILETGTEVRLRSSGARYRVDGLLGRGGQGAVFRITDGRSAPLALKWYRPAAASHGQHARLERLLGFSRPSSEFLWPIEFATRLHGSGWGYVMPLGHADVVPLGRVVKGGVDMRLRTLVESAAQVVQAFKRLHGMGLCYADVSLNNVLVHTGDGRIQICDNDNVTIDGRPSDVLGTPYYIAPEVVRREANPSIASDRHSLAVMLFCMLVRQHPLLGARDAARRVLDEGGLTELLGVAPVFVFDPDDASNRPVEGVHDNLRVLWPVLPAGIRRLFVRAFTEGLRDPSSRVTEGEWLEALLRLRGLVRCCHACGAEQFADADTSECAAASCRAPLPSSAVLTGRPRRPVVLEVGKLVLRSDITGALESDDRTVAEVVRHPATSGLALRNRSDAAWSLLRDGRKPSVPPSAAVLLRDGQRVEMQGVVVAISLS